MSKVKDYRVAGHFGTQHRKRVILAGHYGKGWLLSSRCRLVKAGFCHFEFHCWQVILAEVDKA